MAKTTKKSKVKPAAARKSQKPARKAQSSPGRGAKSGQRAASPKRPAAKRPKTRTKKAASGKASSKASKRRLGLRGAAPWAARHAAKHAAEAEARNAEPPRPGSARATLRAPAGAEELKTRVLQLHHALAHVRNLRKNLPDTFFEIAIELQRIREQQLYEAKGYTTFESFADRELDLGKAVARQLARVPDVFQEQAARHYGMEAVLAALGALDDADADGKTRSSQAQRAAHPLKPPSGGR